MRGNSITVRPSFGDVGKPEPYVDSSPGNGAYDAGEDFTDINGNGQWDSDMGQAGLGGPATVRWRRSGSGTLAATSELGAVGADATLPQGFTVPSGDSTIIAEVFYDYTPWLFSGVTNPSRLYHRALFRPRFGALTSLE